MPPGQIIAFDGQKGPQASILGPGFHLIPLVNVLFEFDEFPIVWQHRTYGHAADPEYPWGATIYGDKGTLKLDVRKWDFIPRGSGGKKLHGDWVDERFSPNESVTAIRARRPPRSSTPRTI